VRKVLSAKNIIIPPKTTTQIQSKYKSLPTNRLFCFDREFLGVMDAVIDHRNFIAYTNNLENPVTILRNTRLGIIRDYNKEGYYSYMLEPEPTESEPYRAPENLGIAKEPIMAENSLPSA
jgi:hypothetical protein